MVRLQVPLPKAGTQAGADESHIRRYGTDGKGRRIWGTTATTYSFALILFPTNPPYNQIVLIVRLSAIPSHFSTAVFSACDVRFWHFALATFLALPKQLVLVYLGVLLVAAQQGQADAASNTAKNVVLGATFVVTLLMAAYIWVRMRDVRNVLLREQKERRRERETVRMKEAEVAFGERDSIGEVPVWI